MRALAQRLELELCSYHEEDDDCLFSFALQPYWQVGALSRWWCTAWSWSRLAASAAPRIPGTWIPRGAVKQVLYHPGSLVLEDGGWNRRLRIDKNVSAGSVIWHPGSRPVSRSSRVTERFLCIGAAGYRPGGLILAPGERA
ncbi:hypothetical protein P4054_00175 [Pseudomonas aeruginosa]|nr:hypothetical protein [Pseudomonas aeruginosa]